MMLKVLVNAVSGREGSSNTIDSSKSGEDKSMVAAGDLEEREEKRSCRSFGKREEMLVI